ncbi:MAG TPA: endolytic transglycosylase MltG [Candidatus Limnocylindria bacterium]|nr:endolytic transglycosylase MltG [Candidatus Limnocylindria bacterium]
MSTPRSRGPVRAGGAHRPARPRERSGGGPVVFTLFILLLAVVAFVVLRPLAVDAIVAAADDHDTLLRQAPVRALVGPKVARLIDAPADLTAKPVDFTVKRGEIASQIAARLETAKIIRSALAFKFVLYDNGAENALQSGTYEVSAALSPRDLALLFQKAPGDQIALRLIDGWRLTEIAAAVTRAFPSLSAETFIRAAVVGQRNNFVLAGIDPKTPLEGFLYPDTYFLRPDASAEGIVDVLLNTFETKAGAGLRTAALERNVAIYDMVKLASIVEREARDRKESPIIAGLYQNRLDQGIKMDADPTINYAKGGWAELSLDDLKTDTPYNTYLHAGLPPTPICSPGLDALQAAAHPARTPYLYFVAKNDGTGGHAFATTLAEQEANRVKYGNK